MTPAEKEFGKLFRGQPTTTSDGSTASYYELPTWAQELADLIRYKNMNGSQAEMFRALYRGSEASHSDEKRQANKLLTYAIDEVVRTHFPEQSMADFRDQVFKVFESKGEAAQNASHPSIPPCKTCTHCLWDQGKKCMSLMVTPDSGEAHPIKFAWPLCQGKYYRLDKGTQQ